MKLKYFICEGLIKHHRNPLVRFGARLIYIWGLQWLTFTLNRKNGVSCILLRRGMASGDWVPGGSDYDLTIVAKDQWADQAASSIYRCVDRFKKYWPIPVDLNLFSESELDRYLAQGGIRAVEGVNHWQTLSGSFKFDSKTRDRQELSLHAYSEMMDQWANLLNFLITDKKESRTRTRHFLKYFCDIIIFAQYAEDGFYQKMPSRRAGVYRFLVESCGPELKKEVDQSFENGFEPFSLKTKLSLLRAAFHRIDCVSQCDHFRKLPPSWTTIPIGSLPKAFLPSRDFWLAVGERAEKIGLRLLSFHYHQRLYLVCEAESLERALLAPEEMLKLLKLVSCYPGELNLSPILITENSLRALSYTAAYQHSAFNTRGLSVSTQEGNEAHWIDPKLGQLIRVSLTARATTLSTELRRLRFYDPKEAEKVLSIYAVALRHRLQELEESYSAVKGDYWSGSFTP